MTFHLFCQYCCQIGDKMVCFQLHQNPDNRTTYTVQQRVVNSFGLNNTLRYPLEENMEYVVRVRNIVCVCTWCVACLDE